MMNDELKDTSKFKAWISAMRLRTLPLSFSVILMGNAIAAVYPIIIVSPTSEEPLGPLLNWKIFTLTLITTLFLQVLSNFANDYGDALKGADDENRIGPTRAIQSGVLSAKEMLIGIVITSILCLISGIWLLIVAFGTDLSLSFALFLIFGILAIAAAIKYTVGKGAYGYFALGDLFVFLFFGILGVVGSFYLQEKTFDWIVLFPASMIGLLSVAVLNLNNMRDAINDKKVGKKTMAVLLGFEKSKKYHLVLFILAWGPFLIVNGLLAYFDLKYGLFILLGYGPFLTIHILHLTKVFRFEDRKQYDPELKKIALSTFGIALVTFVSVILFHAN